MVRQLKMLMVGGAAGFVAARLPGADAAGRGIPPLMQVNKSHVQWFNLPPRLTAEHDVCIPGTRNYTKMQEFIDQTSPGAVVPCCDDGGLFMPLIPYEYLWDNNFRAFLYIISLLWCFVGVSVLADAFMAGIEAITSWTNKTQVPRVHRDGQPVNDATGKQILDTVEVPVWNEKVACLTLFALGSSAPEILIACLGCAPDFFEDALVNIISDRESFPL